MSVQIFVVAHFDNEKLCLTTEQAQKKSVGGREYLFTNQIDSIKLPNRAIEPLAETVANQKITVEYFDKSLNPGHALRYNQRFQGRDVQVFIFDDSNTELLTFEGQVNSFKYNIDECKITFTASAQRSSTKTLFPPGSLLEEGRFVQRKSLDTGKYQQTGYNQRIQYLVPTLEFETLSYGTPSNPTAGFTFLKQRIAVAPSTFVQPAGAHLFFDGRASDLPVPVVYGQNTNVALNILGHYRVTNYSSVFAKIFICILAGHRVIGDPNVPGTSGDFRVDVRYDDIRIQGPFGRFETDTLNSEFSYITVPVLYDNVDFENLDPVFPSNFDINNSYISTLIGKPGVGGAEISGLYDVVTDLWLSYGGAVSDQVDWQTASQSRDSLNALEVAAVFNARDRNQTLLDILTQRFQGQFPIAFGFPLGKLTWQSVLLQNPSAKPDAVKKIIYGENSIQRESVSQTSISKIVNNLKVAFSINGNSGSESQSVLLDASTNEIAKVSEDRYGKSDLSEMKIQDTPFADTAVIVGVNELLKFGGVRFEVQYVMSDPSFVSLPFMSIISVTDEQCGFEDEPFYYLGITWDNQLTVFTVNLLSVKMI